MNIDLSVFNPQARPLLGVDISTTAIKMVGLSKKANKIYLDAFAIEPLPRDAIQEGNINNMEEVVTAMTRCLRRLGTGVKHAAIAIPTASVITKIIRLPSDLSENAMEVQVESEANQYIPFPIEEVNLDFQILGNAPNTTDEVEVLLAACRREKVDDRVACVESAGLKASVVDVESHIQHASFRRTLAGKEDMLKGKHIALVEVGAHIMGFTVFLDGKNVYHREQSFGSQQLTFDIIKAYGLEFEEADMLKKSGRGAPDGYLENLLNPYSEALAMEIQRSLQFFYTSTQFNEMEQLFLCGGGVCGEGVVECVESRTKIRTELVDTFRDIVVSPAMAKRMGTDGPTMMIATGLAFRRFAEK